MGFGSATVERYLAYALLDSQPLQSNISAVCLSYTVPCLNRSPRLTDSTTALKPLVTSGVFSNRRAYSLVPKTPSLSCVTANNGMVCRA